MVRTGHEAAVIEPDRCVAQPAQYVVLATRQQFDTPPWEFQGFSYASKKAKSH
jgi:hypothetical protein